LSAAALQELDFLENEGLTVDSFIPNILLHTVAYALLKILNVCRAVAIFVRLDYTLCSKKTPTHIFFHISMCDV